MTINEMKNHLDIKAGAVRACYITVVPGQEATYLMKAQQAKAFIAAGYVGQAPSLVLAEMTATGESAETSCARILTEEAQWTALAGQIETIRRSAKVGVSAAATLEDAEAIYHTAIAQLAAMMPVGG